MKKRKSSVLYTVFLSASFIGTTFQSHAQNWLVAGNAAASTNFLGTTNAQDLRFRTNNTQKMVLTQSGSLGIGTTAPTNKLQIIGTGGGTTDLKVNGRIQTGDALNGGGVWLDAANTQFVGQLTASKLAIHNGGTRITIDNNGFVGVGTSNPVTQLHVEGSNAVLTRLKRLNTGADLTAIAEIENGNGIVWRYGTGGTGNGLGLTSGQFYIERVGSGSLFSIATDGKVKIGNVSTPTGYKLYVETGILTEKVKVALKTSANWADYVFEDSYKLKPLSDVESYIRANKHLEGIPSAEELVKDGGIDMNTMFSKQMAKIEELTLYVIDLNKKIEILNAENLKLKSGKN